MTRYTRTLTATCALLALAATACGSSAKKVDPQADLALAKAAVLTKADVPAGYTGTPYKKANDDLPGAAKRTFARCEGVPTTFFDEQKDEQVAHSDDFDRNVNSISNDVTIYASKKKLDGEYTVMSNSKTPGCLSRLFAAAFKASEKEFGGAKLGTAMVTTFPVTGAGDRALGFHVTVPLSGAGRTMTLYLNFLFAQRGRALVSIDTLASGGQQFDHSIEVSMMRTVVERLGAKV